MSMNFLDETDDWLEYQTIRDEIQRLDKEHLEIGEKLKKAELALESDFGNESLQANVEGLQKRMKVIEKKLDESLSMYR